ncbi:MAG: tetratricopeptide repeat protein [bacterium]|nr:tetratricopeptide repeat protein [bacterium]
MRARTRVAEIYCRRAEYKKALEYASKALDYVMYDPDANYIYGVISRKMGNLLDAKETLGWAARSMKYRSSAYCQIAEIYLIEGNLERALEYLRRSLDYDVRNIKTQQVLSTAYRLLKQPEESRKMLSKILALDPLNHQARFERYLLDPGDEKLDNFKSLIRNELPHETYLEIALYYASLGLDKDALRVLDVAPEQPTLRYWQAHLLRESAPRRSRELLGKAAGLSPYLVFPYREESIPVFEWADKTLAGNWKAKYYLGLIYWGLRRHDDARRVLEASGNKPDYAPFYICRAYLEKDSDPSKALADYERAYETDKKDWRNWRHLAMAHTEQGSHDKAMKLAVQASKQFPDQDLIKILLARTYMNNGRYGECYSVLENATILPFEGQRDVHELFVQCQISMALGDMKQARFAQAVERLESSKEYPERLGTGRPHDPDSRVQDYLLALCYEKMGNSAKAGQVRQSIQAYAGRHQKEDVTAIGKQVDRWYGTTLASQRELEALQELSKLVLVGRRTRH